MDNPYKILGVRENASRQEIVGAYGTIEAKYRKAQQQGVTIEGLDEEGFAKIEQAYCQLMGLAYHPPGAPRDEVPMNQQPFSKRFENFMYHYKFHVIGAVILCIILGVFIKDIAFRKPTDITVAVVGACQAQETIPFENDIRKTLDLQNDIVIMPMYIGDDIDQGIANANRMKLMAMVANSEVDMFIMDETFFSQYVKNGAMKPLDSLLAANGLDKKVPESARLTTETDSQPHIYGIDITDSKYFTDLGFVFAKSKVYLAVSPHSAHGDRGEKLFLHIASQVLK